MQAIASSRAPGSSRRARRRILLRTLLLALGSTAFAAVATSCAARATAPPAAGTTNPFDETAPIAALLAGFADLVSRRDFAAMTEMFTEDAEWQASAGALGFHHVGRAAITRWLAENPNHVEVVFYLASPPAITQHSPDRATARTSMTELLRLKRTGELLQLFGSYTDELVRRDGRWRFAHRRFELRHQQPAAAAATAAAATIKP